MASSPKFKVYRFGEYVAACKFPEDAAAILGMGGPGEIRLNHKEVLYKTEDGCEAANSYDEVAQQVYRAMAPIA